MSARRGRPLVCVCVVSWGQGGRTGCALGAMWTNVAVSVHPGLCGYSVTVLCENVHVVQSPGVTRYLAPLAPCRRLADSRNLTATERWSGKPSAVAVKPVGAALAMLRRLAQPATLHARLRAGPPPLLRLRPFVPALASGCRYLGTGDAPEDLPET